jgi:hypothetical protein
MGGVADLDEMFNKTGLVSDLDIFDYNLFIKERKEIEKISNALPSDSILDVSTIHRLMRLIIRGLNICDNWIPKLHVILSYKEIERDRDKANAYINADLENKKLTVELRKNLSEVDEQYIENKLIVEKIKASKLFFERKRDTFKTSYFMLKAQLDTYSISDKSNSGEELEYEASTKENW